MSKFSAFMAQNKVKHENVKYRLSADFLDEEGKPAEWEIRRLGAEENDQLQKQCIVKVPVPGNPNQYTKELNDTLYTVKAICAAVVFPDLNDKDLQDSYHVMGAENLIRKMLSAGDYLRLSNKVSEINGFKNLNEAVDEAKN